MQKIVDQKYIIDKKSVQGCIEAALHGLHPLNKINTVVSSRTDAGVHALDSTLHVDLQRFDGEPFNAQKVTDVLNRTFKKEKLAIRISNTRIVSNLFHCRRNALGRTYVYRLAVCKPHILNTILQLEQNVPIEELNRCYFMHFKDFQIERLKVASKLFLGRHDFRTFMSTNREKRQQNPASSVKIIESLTVTSGKSCAFAVNGRNFEEKFDYWDIEIKANSFLYKQVRRIVGTLISLAIGCIDERCIINMLNVPSKYSWNPVICMPPPEGLYLCQVHYNEKDLIYK